MQQQNSPEVSAKLTDWANEPTLIQVKRDLEAARPSHDTQVIKIKQWNDMLHVTGTSKPHKVKGRSSVQPKLIRRQAEWRYPALSEPFLGTNKLFSVTPVTFEDSKSAQQNELVLNYQFRCKLNRVTLIDEYVRANVDEGTCIVQVGWCRQSMKVTEEVPVYQHIEPTSQEEVDALQQAMQLKEQNPREYNELVSPELKAAVDYFAETQQLSVALQTGTEKISVEKLIQNYPTAKIMNPANVIIDPSCDGDIDKAMFVVVSFETNLAALKMEGKRYKNLDQINWDGTAPIYEPHHATNTPNEFNLADKMRKKVVAYEYWGFWDVNNEGKLEPFVCTWIGHTMIRMEMNPFPDGKLPFVVTRYLPVKRELYGEPDAELLEDNQKVMGALMRGMIDLLGRSANSQQGFAKGMLDPLNRRRYDAGQDYEFNPNMPPANGMITHKYPELPQSALMMLNLQNQDAEALSGVKSFSGGLSGSAFGDVAAGIRGALDAASKREMTILRRLAKGIIDIGKKFVSMNAVFLSEEEVIRITNEEFIKIQREDLKGNYDLDVDISTAEVDNAKAQDLAFMLQTLGNSVDQMLTLKILASICKLKRMPELAEELLNFQPQPNPAAEKMQQLEMAMLEAKIEQAKSEAALNNAKAQELMANLEDKISGTDHARKVDLMESQAQGNKELEITKALTRPKKVDQQDPDIEAAVGYNQITGNNPRLTQPQMPIQPDQSILPIDNYQQSEDLAATEPELTQPQFMMS